VLDVVRILLRRSEVNINLQQKENATPLYIACQEGHLDIVEVLLADPRVDVNRPRTGGFTPFHVACEWNRVDIVRAMIREAPRVDIYQPNDEFTSPLLAACAKGNAEIVKILLLVLTTEASVNVQRRDRATPFLMAVQNGHQETVEVLLQDQRVHIDQAKTDGITPLWVACNNGSLGIVKRILACAREDLDLEAKWKVSQLTALQQSVSRRQNPIAEVLVRYIADRDGARMELRRELGLLGKQTPTLDSPALNLTATSPLFLFFKPRPRLTFLH